MRKKRVPTLKIADFKDRAYNTARNWESNEYSDEWIEKEINLYQDSSLLSLFRETIELYVEFLKNKAMRGQAHTEQRIVNIEKGFLTYSKAEQERRSDSLGSGINNLFAMGKARDDAFIKAGIEFGKVQFQCPICQGDAFAVKFKTNDQKGKAMQSGCSGCKLTTLS